MANGQQSADYEGVLLIDKPSGMTSHDVVDKVRRTLHMKRIGHAGTLDPLATGLLIILVGKATKVSQYLMSLDKAYTGVMKLGESTDSHDADGEITETRPIPELSRAQVDEVFNEFIGDQYQTPPMYSAKKHKGKALYKYARKGQEIEREPRFIRISELDILDVTLPTITFHMECSKGTYVRTFAHDVGEKLGCGAHLTALRRTAIDRFSIAEAIELEAFMEATPADINRALIPIYQAVPSKVI